MLLPIFVFLISHRNIIKISLKIVIILSITLNLPAEL